MFLFPQADIMKLPLWLHKSIAAVKKSPLEIAALVVMTVLLGYGVVPSAVMADERALDFPINNRVTQLRVAAMQNELKPFGTFPAADLRGPSYMITVPSTAYNSLAGQTDSTPFITASGTRTRHGVVAANFLPIGTRIKIPEYYGDQIFIVEDRMNRRYDKKIDIWMESYDDAIQFGARNITVEVYL